MIYVIGHAAARKTGPWVRSQWVVYQQMDIGEGFHGHVAADPSAAPPGLLALRNELETATANIELTTAEQSTLFMVERDTELGDMLDARSAEQFRPFPISPRRFNLGRIGHLAAARELPALWAVLVDHFGAPPKSHAEVAAARAAAERAAQDAAELAELDQFITTAFSDIRYGIGKEKLSGERVAYLVAAVARLIAEPRAMARLELHAEAGVVVGATDNP